MVKLSGIGEVFDISKWTSTASTGSGSLVQEVSTSVAMGTFLLLIFYSRSRKIVLLDAFCMKRAFAERYHDIMKSKGEF